MKTIPAYWAIIPAAGTGVRMGQDLPKQYLKLRGQTILEHSLRIFHNHPKIKGVVVVLAENDPNWHTLTISSEQRIHTTIGGAERCHSVLNGLNALPACAQDSDWVLVHDAARPCLRLEDLDKLINTISADSNGGILAIPAVDTLKRASNQNVILETVDRRGLWHALTPQMFRVSMLKTALEKVVANQVMVTDEAQAMEMSGIRPELIEGHHDNIKITHPNDLPLAELFLSLQENEK